MSIYLLYINYYIFAQGTIIALSSFFSIFRFYFFIQFSSNMMRMCIYICDIIYMCIYIICIYYIYII